MGAYIARRLLQVIPVIILVSIIVFVMIRLIPGDPAIAMLGIDVSPLQIEAESYSPNSQELLPRLRQRSTYEW